MTKNVMSARYYCQSTLLLLLSVVAAGETGEGENVQQATYCRQKGFRRGGLLAGLCR